MLLHNLSAAQLVVLCCWKHHMLHTAGWCSERYVVIILAIVITFAHMLLCMYLFTIGHTVKIKTDSFMVVRESATFQVLEAGQVAPVLVNNEVHSEQSHHTRRHISHYVCNFTHQTQPSKSRSITLHQLAYFPQTDSDSTQPSKTKVEACKPAGSWRVPTRWVDWGWSPTSFSFYRSDSGWTWPHLTSFIPLHLYTHNTHRPLYKILLFWLYYKYCTYSCTHVQYIQLIIRLSSYLTSIMI